MQDKQDKTAIHVKAPEAIRVKAPEPPMADVPRLQANAAEANAMFRELAEKGLAQAKDAFARMKTASEEASSMLETTCANASKGATDYGLRMVEMGRANSNAAFDFAAELMSARTLAQMVEISTAHTRKHIMQVTEQVKELTSLAQKVATTTAEPIKDGLSGLARKAA
jgi:phasin